MSTHSQKPTPAVLRSHARAWAHIAVPVALLLAAGGGSGLLASTGQTLHDSPGHIQGSSHSSELAPLSAGSGAASDASPSGEQPASTRLSSASTSLVSSAPDAAGPEGSVSSGSSAAAGEPPSASSQSAAASDASTGTAAVLLPSANSVTLRFALPAAVTAGRSASDLLPQLSLSLQDRLGREVGVEKRLGVSQRGGVLTVTPVSAFAAGTATFSLSLRQDRGFLHALGAQLGLSPDPLLLQGSVPLGTFVANADKDLYGPGNTAHLSFSLLSAAGEILCNEPLQLSQTSATLETQCEPHPAADSQDYSVSAPVAGTTTLRLTASGSTREVPLAVPDASALLSLKRTAPTRVAPGGKATVLLTVYPFETFIGSVTETVPGALRIAEAPNATVASVGSAKTLTWQRRFEAGTPAILSYTIEAPALTDATVFPFGPLTAKGTLETVPAGASPSSSALPVSDSGSSLSATGSASSRADPSSAPALAVSSSSDSSAGQTASDGTAAAVSSASSSNTQSSAAASAGPLSFLSHFLASLFDSPASSDASTATVGFTESRSWHLLVASVSLASKARAISSLHLPATDSAASVAASDTTPQLQLTPSKAEFDAHEQPTFKLLEATLPGTAGAPLDPTLALSTLVNATTTDDALVQKAAEAIVADQKGRIATGVLQDSLAVTDMRGALGEEVGSARRTDVLQQKITETIDDTPALRERLRDIALQDGTVATGLAGTLTPAVRTAIVAAAVTGTGADAAIAAVLEQRAPQTTSAVKEAVAATLAATTDAAQAVADSVAGKTVPADDATQPILTVTLTGKNGAVIHPKYHFVKGSVLLVLEPERAFTPGVYTLQVTVHNPLTGADQTVSQDFAWGVLAMNPNQDRYQPGDKAHLAFGVLDDKGEMVCDATLFLTVRSPSRAVTTLSTGDQSIAVTQSCQIKRSDLVDPDYEAFLSLTEPGTYTLHLEATTKSGTRSLDASLQVAASFPYVISRRAATRLYPVGISPTDITVHFTDAFAGTIADIVPEGFVVSNASPRATVTLLSGTGTRVAWMGRWQAGETAAFHYDYDAPNISPEFYLIGPLQIGTQSELRSWQIANDAVKTWDGGGTTNNWSDCVNWSGDTCPTSSDTVTFDNTSAKNATIDTAIDVAGVNIYATYTGTITQSAAMTIGTSGWTQSGATFTGGSQAITMNGPFVQASGTFTATTGTTTFSQNCNCDATLFRVVSGATFNHNNGSVLFQGLFNNCCGGGTYTVDVPASFTLNNVSTDTRGGNGTDTITLAPGETLTALGTFSLINGSIGGNWRVQGNVSIAGSGGLAQEGSGSIILTGTGNQTYAYTAPGLGPFFRMTKLSGTVTPASGTTDLKVTGLILTSGSFTAPSGTLTLYIRNNADVSLFTVSGGTFLANGGTVSLTPLSASCVSHTYALDVPSSLHFFNLNLNSLGGSCGGTTADFPIPAGQTAVIDGALTVTKGTIDGSWNVSGDLTIAASAGGGTASIVVSGSSNQTIESEAGGTWPSGTLSVQKTAGVASLSGSLTLNATGQNVVIGSGSLSLNGNSLAVNSTLSAESGGTLQLQGAETISAATKTLKTGSTVKFTGNGNSAANTYNVTNYFGASYKNLTVQATDGATDVFALTGALVVAGDLRNMAGTVDVSASNYGVSLAGSFENAGSFNARSGTVTFNGTAAGKTLSGSTTFNNVTVNGAGGQWTQSRGISTVGGTLTVTAGTLIVGTRGSVTTTGTSTTLSVGASGRLNNSGTLTLGGAPTPASIAGTWRNATGSTVILAGQSDNTAVAVPSIRYGNFRINKTGTTFTLANTLSSSGAITLSAGTLDVTTANYPIVVAHGWTDTALSPAFTPRSGSVIFTGTGTVTSNDAFSGVILRAPGATATLGSSLALRGNLSLESGRLDASPSNYPVSLSGAWLSKTAATFVSHSGSVVLSGLHQTMSGSTSFWNLTKSGATAAQLTLAAGTTQTVKGTLRLRGAASNLLSLRSSQTGNQWKINPVRTRDIAFLDVKDSNNLNASVISCSDNCTNSTNNTNWIFPIAGTAYADEGVTPLGAGRTVSMAVDGGAPTSTTTDASGQFSITTPPSYSSGSVLTFYLDNDSEKGVAVHLASNGTPSPVLYQNRLIVASDQSRPLTTAHLNTADNNGDTDITAFYAITGNDLTVTTGKKLYVRSGTYQPGGNVAVEDMAIRGTLTMGSNALNVSGNFDSAGGSFTTTGTATFDAATAKTLTPGTGNKFLHLTFNGAGKWTLNSPLSVSGALRLVQGTLDLFGKNLDLNGGVFASSGTLLLGGNETLTAFSNDTRGKGNVVFYGSGSYSGLGGQSAFANLSLSGAGVWTLTSAISTANSLTLSGGTLDVSSSNYGIRVGSNWTSRRSALFAKRGGTVTFAGTGSINSNQAFSGVIVNTRGTTVTLASNLAAAGNLTISGGTLAVSSGNFGVTLSGAWLKKSIATFTSGSGTVTLNGPSQTLSGSTAFWNLRKTVTSAATLAFAAGTTQTVRGTWTAQGANSNLLSLRSSQTGNQWKINPIRTRTLSFIDVKDSNNTNATTILCSSDCTNSGNNSNWAFPTTVTVYSDSGSTLIGAGKTVAVAVNGGTKTTATTDVNSVATFTTVGLSPGDVVTMWLDDNAQVGTTVTVTNATTLAFSIYKDYLIVENEFGPSITNANLTTAHNVNDADVNAIYTMSGTQLVMRPGKTLLIKSGSTYAPGSRVYVDNIRIQGTFAMGSNNVTVAGSWNATGGSFTGSNTVTFLENPSSTITSGGSSFNNIVFQIDNNSSAQWTTTDTLNVNGSQRVQSVAGTADTTPPIISAVSGSLITDTQALIAWTTDESANSRVLYGTASGTLTSSVSQDTYNVSHALIVSGLTPSTLYYYRVVSKDFAGNTATGSLSSFRTTQLSTAEEVAAAVRAANAGGGTAIHVQDACSSALQTPFAVSNLRVVPRGSGSGGSAVVTWATNAEGISAALYGSSSVREAAQADFSAFTVAHVLTIGPLKPQATYHVQAVSVSRCGKVALSEEVTFVSTGSTLETGKEAAPAPQAVPPEESVPVFKSVLEQLVALAKKFPDTVSVAERKELAAAVREDLLRELARKIPGPVLGGEPLVDVTDTTATVRWTTDDPANSLVSISPESLFGSGSYVQTIGDPFAQTGDHTVSLIGLTPGTRYHYRVQSVTAVGVSTTSRDFTFVTSQQVLSILSYAAKVLSPRAASFTWATNFPASTALTVTPYRGGQPRPESARTVQLRDVTLSHTLSYGEFEPGVRYDVELWGKSQGGTIVSKTLPRFSTSKTDLSPQILSVQTDTALSPGKDAKIQAVVSWATSDESTSQVFYQKGVSTDPQAAFRESTPVDQNYTRKHVLVLPALDPGQIYSFQVESIDGAGHGARSRTFTILTPRQEEGIFQIILKQMEGAFGWLGKLRGA